MHYEIETKVLDIDVSDICKKLDALGAQKIADTTLQVDWFRTHGVQEGEDEWFLRIRTSDTGKAEITWKAKSQIQGVSRKHQEINIAIADPKAHADLFEAIGLELYAHQDKRRTSWTYREWRFDLDQYPGMPAFLEVEGQSEENVQEALVLLGLEGNRTWAEGERTLIQEVYGLDWYHMYFTT